MNPFDPILDQPQSIDHDHADRSARYRLANQDIYFDVDTRTDLHDLVWPWADALYVRSIRLQITDPQHDELMALVTRYFPGYQETILGNDGMIISKRLAAPLSSAYDRAVLWMLDCQAEGDRLIRLDVEIDWGEPLTQRMVDGLLVAQRNPEGARGIYAQHNAESTRVFGNPQGRPTAFQLDAAGRAQLTYFILVNGMVEVPLLLTLSDVGEQVAWNGFLGLRDAERAFELSAEAWERAVKTGRLWTSDPRINRAVQTGRLAAVRSVQRLRTGLAPSGRRVTDVPTLVAALDAFDVTSSRNLLAHVRRVAERSGGRLPPHLPVRPKDELEEPGRTLAANNSAYLTALLQHLQRHPDAELLAEHYGAVSAVAEALVQLRWQAQNQADAVTYAVSGVGLRQAVTLATLQKDGVNAVRWESEACELERLAEEAGAPPPPAPISVEHWASETGWQLRPERPWSFANPLAGAALAGSMVWTACGLQRRNGKLWVYPKRANPWRWWALVDLPTEVSATGSDRITLVWDGATLYTTRPVQSDQPVAVCSRIRVLHTDELDFRLEFELTPAAEHGAPGERRLFRPIFDTA
ncbi:MAG TPA: hypothetical protein VNK95_13445 [Caldilineaceae bacterium]|nr:hypothetical protein [Caldilineaceae bacterium]